MVVLNTSLHHTLKVLIYRSPENGKLTQEQSLLEIGRCNIYSYPSFGTFSQSTQQQRSNFLYVANYNALQSRKWITFLELSPINVHIRNGSIFLQTLPRSLKILYTITEVTAQEALSDGRSNLLRLDAMLLSAVISGTDTAKPRSTGRMVLIKLIQIFAPRQSWEFKLEEDDQVCTSSIITNQNLIFNHFTSYQYREEICITSSKESKRLQPATSCSKTTRKITPEYYSGDQKMSIIFLCQHMHKII